MDIVAAIRRLAFAEARNSSTEAMMAIAQRTAEVVRTVAEAEAARKGAAEEAKAAEFVDNARTMQAVDKTA